MDVFVAVLLEQIQMVLQAIVPLGTVLVPVS